MKTFLSKKRKLVELGILLGINAVLFFIWPQMESVVLFSLGYIWNWTASQDMSFLFKGGRYRFSILKLVFDLHKLVILPFKKLPAFTHILPKVLPAGLIWYLVMAFMDGQMPLWAIFIGSLVYELMQVDLLFVRPHEEKIQ